MALSMTGLTRLAFCERFGISGPSSSLPCCAPPWQIVRSKSTSRSTGDRLVERHPWRWLIPKLAVPLGDGFFNRLDFLL
jgi:hypothetical protein